MTSLNSKNNTVNYGYRFFLLVLSILLLGLDQFTKWLVITHIEPYSSIAFLPHWNWVLAFNTGAAFSFLHDPNGWYKYGFLVFTALVSIGLCHYILTKNYNKYIGIGYSLILGGALGNLTDRIVRGQVVDFIDWYVSNYHWPSFNVADSCVLTGVVIIILVTQLLDNINEKAKK
jgi:signal peptidase II